LCLTSASLWQFKVTLIFPGRGGGSVCEPWLFIVVGVGSVMDVLEGGIRQYTQTRELRELVFASQAFFHTRSRTPVEENKKCS